jgi:hypothetical protein
MSRFILALTILSIACDAEPTEQCPAGPGLSLSAPAGSAPSIAFREQGPPEGLVVTELGGDAITRDGFVKLIMACAEQEDPPLTCTLSWYQPDVSNDERVMGLGCSTLATAKLLDCYEQVWLSQGAKPL